MLLVFLFFFPEFQEIFRGILTVVDRGRRWPRVLRMKNYFYGWQTTSPLRPSHFPQTTSICPMPMVSSYDNPDKVPAKRFGVIM